MSGFVRFLSSALCCAFLSLGVYAQDAQEVQDPDDLPATEAEVSPPVDMWDRIRRGFSMPALDSPKVDQMVRFYAPKRDYFERVSERAGKYLYYIVGELEERKMPTELALLPFVESAFQPEALSAARAAGLWQFIPVTATNYALQQNLWKDDRRGVLESTRAACDYLQKLYDQFHDWQLALAAYNWGEGAVQRAVAKATAQGKPADYEHLRMPRETSFYAPRLMAIKEIVAHPEKYGIELPDIENTPYFVSITKSRHIDMKTAAELAEMDLKEFRRLNMDFNRPVIVASHEAVFLLPADRAEIFMNNLASWVNTGKPLSSWLLYTVQPGDSLKIIADRTGMTEEELRRVNHVPQGRGVAQGSTLLVDANGKIAPEIEKDALDAQLRLTGGTRGASTRMSPDRQIVYRVRRGDTLFSIAKKFGVTQQSIRVATGLKAPKMRIGQRLIIPVAGKPIATVRVGSSKTFYTVKRGDTLFSIARKNRVELDNISELNRLKSHNLFVGQVLRIR